MKRRYALTGLALVAAMALVATAIGGPRLGSSDQSGATKAAKKRGPRGPAGPAGPAGTAGSQGPQGPAGVAGANGFGTMQYIATDHPVNLGDGANSNVEDSAPCPVGLRPTGGGVETSPATVRVNTTRPAGGPPPTKWEAAINVVSGGPVTNIRVWVICANAVNVSGP